MPSDSQINNARSFYNRWSDDSLLERIELHENTVHELSKKRRLTSGDHMTLAVSRRIAEVTTIILEERLK